LFDGFFAYNGYKRTSPTKEELSMPPIVKVESAGTHLYHATERNGEELKLAGELCEHLLNKSGYTKDLVWLLRVEKTLHCDDKSRVVRVVGFNNFGVKIRFKARSNDTLDHQYTLIRPDNTTYAYEDLMKQLKGCEKSISRQWREDVRQARIQKPVSVAVPSINGDHVFDEEKDLLPYVGEIRPDFKTLAGTLTNFPRLQYLFRRIHKLSKSNDYNNARDWREALMKECEFDTDGHLSRHVAITLSTIAGRGYFTDFHTDKCILVGFKLSALGKRLAGGDLKALEEAEEADLQKKISNKNKPVNQEEENIPVPVKVPKKDIGQALIDITEEAQLLADAGKRVQTIRFEKKNISDNILALQRQILNLQEEEDKVTAEVSKIQKFLKFV
jgi:hypothetical protein